MAGPRIVIGGDNAWTPPIVKDMPMPPLLRGARFVLHAIRRAADLGPMACPDPAMYTAAWWTA